MADRAKLGFKKGNRKARSNRRNKDFNFSEEKFDSRVKRQQRRRMKIQKEENRNMKIENMNIEDLKEYILETEY